MKRISSGSKADPSAKQDRREWPAMKKKIRILIIILMIMIMIIPSADVKSVLAEDNTGDVSQEVSDEAGTEQNEEQLEADNITENEAVTETADDLQEVPSAAKAAAPEESGDSAIADEEVPSDPQFDDETGGADESSYDSNPPAPSDASHATLIGSEVIIYSGNNKTRSFTFQVGNNTNPAYYGHGICVFDTRNAAKKGSSGWLKELTPQDMVHPGNYMDVIKLIYWGEYKDNTVSNAKKHLAIHRICTFWVNGRDALRDWVNSDMGNKSSYAANQGLSAYLAHSDDETVSAITRDKLKIYLWIPEGSASKKQIALFYRVQPPARVTVKKQPAPSDTDFLKEAPENYTLAGAVYRMYTDSGCTQQAADIYGNPVEWTTDAAGNSPVIEADPGVYYICEVAASKGYKIDKVIHQATLVSDADTLVTSTEEPSYGLFSAYLIKSSDEHGWKRLIGAEYTLCYYDIDLGYGDSSPDKDTISGKNPTRKWVFRAREGEYEGVKAAMIDFASDTPVSGGSMFTEHGVPVMPNGVFTLKETDPPVGLAADPVTYFGRVQQPENGHASVSKMNGSDTLSAVFSNRIRIINDEPDKTIVLRLHKVDAETGKGEAQGADREYSKGSLKGAEYEVYVEDPDYTEDQYAGTIITDENGYGELTTDAHRIDPVTGKPGPLRPGRYFITEKKASPGYLPDSYDAEDVRGVYEDGRHIVVARTDDDDNQIVYSFDIVSEDPPITAYFHKTDVTGDCPELPGATLQIINSDGNIVEEWVSTIEPHAVKALPEGKYTLREITAPYGYQQAEDAEFEIVGGKAVQHVHMDNKPIPRIIGTVAQEKASLEHNLMAGPGAVVVDTVSYKGLVPGEEYTITGELFDKTTGQLTGITASAVFRPEKSDGQQSVVFSFDATLLENHTLVAFEKLMYAGKVTDTHEDPDDPAQTIYVPKVRTSLGKIKGHKITDIVKYENLIPGKTYVIGGYFVRKSDGKKVRKSDGVKRFVPSAPDGEVEVVLNSKYGHGKIVAFEHLFIVGQDGKLTQVGSHTDLNDKEQCYDAPAPSPKTGDDNFAAVYMLLLGISLSALLLIIKRRAQDQR